MSDELRVMSHEAWESIKTRGYANWHTLLFFLPYSPDKAFNFP